MADRIRLTQLAKRAGCAAKHPPGCLLPMLGALPAVQDPNVLIDSATSDDAAVYKLDDERALVLTTDFFTRSTLRPASSPVASSGSAKAVSEEVSATRMVVNPDGGLR